MLTHRSSSLLRIVAGLVLAMPATISSAQLFDARSPLRGSGQIQTCDTSMHVSFSTTFLGNYGCAFDAEVDAGSTVVQSTSWYYYSDPNWIGTEFMPTVYYASQEPYPVCLNVNAYDLVAQQPCSTTVCQLITPLPEPICASLVADFTVGAVDGSTITFQDLTTFDGGAIGAAYWSFGDGTAATSATNTNTFSGSGPFEVCLTIVGAPPSECVSSVCKWLYLGPGNVQCPVLVEQGYQLLTFQNLVGVWDTSRTSGMYSKVDWDFGDGAEGTGTIAVHAYAQSGTYDLCGTLKVWGLLLPDTCTSTICHSVDVSAAVGVADIIGEPEVWAFPSPFGDALTVHLDGADSELRVLDPAGRVVFSQMFSGVMGSRPVDLSMLRPGAYIATLHSADGIRSARIVKQ